MIRGKLDGGRRDDLCSRLNIVWRCALLLISVSPSSAPPFGRARRGRFERVSSGVGGLRFEGTSSGSVGGEWP